MERLRRVSNPAERPGHSGAANARHAGSVGRRPTGRWARSGRTVTWEAGRLAYRDRDAFVADMSQVDVPVAKMLDRDYLNALGRLIKDDKAMVNLPAAGEAIMPPHRDTIYLCVVDKDGNACSFTLKLAVRGFRVRYSSERSGSCCKTAWLRLPGERGHPNCIARGSVRCTRSFSGWWARTDRP